jgi:hypothetical protein
MTKKKKLFDRFINVPADFTWDELKSVLGHLGYVEIVSKGKSSGSRTKFVNAQNRIISLHRPHPDQIIKKYVIRQLLESLDL